MTKIPSVSPKPTILVLAFGVIRDDKDQDNMSERALRALADTHPDATIVKCLLPVEYKAAFLKLQQALQTHKPAFTIMLGEGGMSGSIRMEHHASSQATQLDNLGKTPADYNVPDQYRELTSLNPQLMRIVELASNKQLRNSDDGRFNISANSGSFLCNYAFYHAMSLQQNNGRTMFLHLGESDALTNAFYITPFELELLNVDAVSALNDNPHYFKDETNRKPFEELNKRHQVECAQYENDQRTLPQHYAQVITQVITAVARTPEILDHHVSYNYESCSTAAAPEYIPPDYLGQLTPPSVEKGVTAQKKLPSPAKH